MRVTISHNHVLQGTNNDSTKRSTQKGNDDLTARSCSPCTSSSGSGGDQAMETMENKGDFEVENRNIKQLPLDSIAQKHNIDTHSLALEQFLQTADSWLDPTPMLSNNEKSNLHAPDDICSSTTTKRISSWMEQLMSAVNVPFLLRSSNLRWQSDNATARIPCCSDTLHAVVGESTASAIENNDFLRYVNGPIDETSRETSFTFSQSSSSSVLDEIEVHSRLSKPQSFLLEKGEILLSYDEYQIEPNTTITYTATRRMRRRGLIVNETHSKIPSNNLPAGPPGRRSMLLANSHTEIAPVNFGKRTESSKILKTVSSSGTSIMATTGIKIWPQGTKSNDNDENDTCANDENQERNYLDQSEKNHKRYSIKKATQRLRHRLTSKADTEAEIGTAAQGNEDGEGESQKNEQHPSATPCPSSRPPLSLLIVRPEEIGDLERNISELTMRSCYTASQGWFVPTATGNYGKMDERDLKALPKIPNDNRRMAYYAVGKHHHNRNQQQLQNNQQLGKTNNSGAVKGGNRRCYFTGKLILNNAPFYAGCVEQGLRTLVVFCLPSALGLPNPLDLQQCAVSSVGGGSQRQHPRIGSSSTINSSQSAQMNLNPRSFLVKFAKTGTGSTGKGSNRSIKTRGSVGTYASSVDGSSPGSPANPSSNCLTPRTTPPLYLEGRGSGHGMGSGRSKSRSIATLSQQSCGTRSTRRSRFTATSGGSDTQQDETTLGLSIESDLDPNWSLDRDALLAVLPPVDDELIRLISSTYPEQFETIPVQVRDATKWKLYIKFCFFSGLPIGREEIHYKIRDDISEDVYFGEEIVLSHEVMVAAVSLASAELLALPNRTVLRYLRKHYSQQCAKLVDDRVYQRSSWERIAPEV
jgi:hypothetical protein